jgi:RNA polymerase sigma-70 factor (ECF subfamily)
VPESDQRDRVLRLAVEHRAAMWAFAKGLAKNPHLAEDVLQDTFVVICEKCAQYHHGTNFLAWARTIIRYRFLAAVDPARHRLVSVESEVLEQALAATESDGDALAERRDAWKDCLDRVRGRARKVLELRYRDGLGIAHLAERLRLSRNALYTLLSRARRALRDCAGRRTRMRGVR